jgi:hypothetical protein
MNDKKSIYYDRHGYPEIEQMRNNENWQALQSFYRLKSLLLPSFMEKNKRALNLIESKLMQEYEMRNKPL